MDSRPARLPPETNHPEPGHLGSGQRRHRRSPFCHLLHRLGRGLLIGVLALDLLSFGSGYNPAIPTSEFYPSTPGLAYLRGHASGYRVLAAIHDGRLWPGDVLNMYGVDSVTAYDPYRDDSFLRLLDVSDRERRLWIVTGSVWLGTSINLDNPALDELGVKLAYFPDDVGAAPEYTSDHWEVVYSARDGRIYENRQALPKQFLVPSGGGSAVPVDHRPAFPDADQLTVQGPGLLVWSRPNDPYWDVTVNGRPVTPTSYHDFFQAVPLADGSNSVAVAYHPRTFYLGALLSLAALLAAAAIVAVGLLRRRRLIVSPPPGR